MVIVSLCACRESEKVMILIAVSIYGFLVNADYRGWRVDRAVGVQLVRFLGVGGDIGDIGQGF